MLVKLTEKAKTDAALGGSWLPQSVDDDELMLNVLRCHLTY